MRVRAYGIIKSHCVLLCMLWVIGSIVFVDTHQNHPARGCGFRARDRAVFGIIALRSIVDSVEYHDCNQSHALRRISKYTKQFVWICFSFLFFFFLPLLFLFFFCFFLFAIPTFMTPLCTLMKPENVDGQLEATLNFYKQSLHVSVYTVCKRTFFADPCGIGRRNITALVLSSFLSFYEILFVIRLQTCNL